VVLEMVLRVGFEPERLAVSSWQLQRRAAASKRCWCGSAAVKAEWSSGSAAGSLAEDQLAPQQDDSSFDKGWKNGRHMLPSVQMNGTLSEEVHAKVNV
jgi:hypothetical protein